MEINFRGQYDKATFFKAVRLANQMTRSQQRFIFIMTLFAIMAFGLVAYRILMSGDWQGNMIFMLASLVLGGGVAWVHLAPYFTARKMWADAGTRRMLRGQITNHGIVYLLDTGRNEIPWGRFRRVRKAEDLVTLVREDGLLVIFPRRFFKKNSDWRKFLMLVEKKLIPRVVGNRGG